MRHLCQVTEQDGEVCDKPAVDCLPMDEESDMWLCAEHWDTIMRVADASTLECEDFEDL